MTKYAVLDAAILKCLPILASGQDDPAPRRFQVINTGEVLSESERIAKTEDRPVDAFRVVDRRLQALRRSEKIAFCSRGWYIVAKRSVGAA